MQRRDLLLAFWGVCHVSFFRPFTGRALLQESAPAWWGNGIVARRESLIAGSITGTVTGSVSIPAQGARIFLTMGGRYSSKAVRRHS